MPKVPSRKPTVRLTREEVYKVLDFHFNMGLAKPLLADIYEVTTSAIHSITRGTTHSSVYAQFMSDNPEYLPEPVGQVHPEQVELIFASDSVVLTIEEHEKLLQRISYLEEKVARAVDLLSN